VRTVTERERALARLGHDSPDRRHLTVRAGVPRRRGRHVRAGRARRGGGGPAAPPPPPPPTPVSRLH
jgi:hypothetical protein